MTVLSNYQFEIGGVVFGIGAPVAVDTDGFSTGSDDVSSQDQSRGVTDSLAFGEDFRTPSSWSWELHTDQSTEPEDAIADFAVLGRVWRGNLYRRTPSVVTPLRYAIGNRTRVVYGRARNWAEEKTNRILSGYMAVTCDFQRADIYFYDDQIQSTSVTILPAVRLGLVTPLVSPITTLSGGSREGTIPAVGGDVSAPFEATIYGPILNPKISTVNWELQLLTSIPAGMSVTISTYPWALRVVRSDGANLSGLLSAKSRLSRARLDPAGETLYFDGTDGTGTASCQINWRPTYTTM